MTATSDSRPEVAAGSFDVHSPVHGRVVGTLPICDRAEVERIATDLRSAQPAWEDLGPKQRGRYLLSWLDWVMDNERRLVEIVQAETGKSWGDAAVEPLFAIEVINYVTKNAESWLRDISVKPHSALHATKRLKVFARPYPLVGVILPWNVPLALPFTDIPYALAAGAAVLSKPSEMTPLAWSEVVRGWSEEVGAPPVLGCVTGFGETGSAVVDVVDMVQFTGSTRTGRKVAAQAGGRLIPCSLELGGKDAMIVLDDADIDRAVGAALTGAMFTSGQACVGVERVYVHESVYEEFMGKLTPRVTALRTGSEADASFTNDLGALVTSTQVDIVERHVNDAVANGARALTGGSRHVKGNYFAPTVLADVDHSMVCMREETFGPVLPVMTFQTDDEAVRLANDSEYGLSGSVFTRNPARAERIARRMETGGVCVNNVLQSVLQLQVPMGGWKTSGVGSRAGGAPGIRKYCRQQGFIADRVSPKSDPNWYPHSRTKAKLMNGALRLFGMHDWRRRLGLRPR